MPRIWRAEPMRPGKAYEATPRLVRITSHDGVMRYTIDGDLHEATVVAPRWSALHGQDGLGEDDESQDEQGEGWNEDALQAKDDEDGRHDGDPAATPDRPGPVATIGDSTMTSEGREPEQGDDRQTDREPDQERADEPGRRIDLRIPGCQDERDQDPDDPSAREEPEIHEPITRIHHERV